MKSPSKVDAPAFDAEVNQRVLVHEPGIAPWEGTVIALKWSAVSGWWCDVRNADGGVWSIPRGSDTVIEVIQEGDDDAG